MTAHYPICGNEAGLAIDGKVLAVFPEEGIDTEAMLEEVEGTVDNKFWVVRVGHGAAMDTSQE